MTVARQRLPGERGMGTRRCDRREFLLRPDYIANHTIAYVLGYQQGKHKLKTMFFVAMSNHYHNGLEDGASRHDHSVTPHFMRDFNSLSARALNACRGRHGALWSGGGHTYNFVRNASTEDLIEEFVYALTNPVAAGLVSHRKKWPGLLLDPGPSGKRTIRVRRPSWFFSYTMPKEVQITLEAPRCDLSPRAFMKEVYRRANIREREIRKQMKSKGLTFLGEKAVLQRSPFEAPKTEEPWPTPNPLFSIRDKRQLREHIQRNLEFLAHYEESRDKLRSGDRDVEFPVGTFKLPAYYSLACEGPDPPT